MQVVDQKEKKRDGVEKREERKDERCRDLREMCVKFKIAGHPWTRNDPRDVKRLITSKLKTVSERKSFSAILKVSSFYLYI